MIASKKKDLQLFTFDYYIDVNDLLNPGRQVVLTLYVYNCRPGLDCSLMSIDVNDLLNSGRRVVFTLYVYNCRPGLD